MDREAFLKELEDEHIKIARLLTELGTLTSDGAVSDADAFTRALGDLEKTITAHLEKEDNIFYNELREKAVELKQDALLPALDFYMNSMHRITEGAASFFERYKDPEAVAKDGGAFATDLEKITETISRRVVSEEGSLFHLYRAYYFD